MPTFWNKSNVSSGNARGVAVIQQSGVQQRAKTHATIHNNVLTHVATGLSAFPSRTCLLTLKASDAETEGATIRVVPKLITHCDKWT